MDIKFGKRRKFNHVTYNGGTIELVGYPLEHKSGLTVMIHHPVNPDGDVIKDQWDCSELLTGISFTVWCIGHTRKECAEFTINYLNDDYQSVKNMLMEYEHINDKEAGYWKREEKGE